MAERNTTRRDTILAAAYGLFGEKQYDHVSLADIAKGAGISKSLLQHYFSQKIDIVKTMLEELLNTSFFYMGEMGSSEELFQTISDFDMLFFKGVAADYKLRQFIRSSVAQEECLDAWVETICRWLRRYCGENTFTYRQLKTAMCFSMGGTMHLFIHQDELDINYRSFCRIHMDTILRFLQYDTGRINEILDHTDAVIQQLDDEKFLQFCEKNIPWLSL